MSLTSLLPGFMLPQLSKEPVLATAASQLTELCNLRSFWSKDQPGKAVRGGQQAQVGGLTVLPLLDAKLEQEPRLSKI